MKRRRGITLVTSINEALKTILNKSVHQKSCQIKAFNIYIMIYDNLVTRISNFIGNQNKLILWNVSRSPIVAF